MGSPRAIIVALAVIVAAMAQQLCCCVVNPAVFSVFAVPEAEASHRGCCHHDAPHDEPADHPADRGTPARHDCACRIAQAFVPLKAQHRLTLLACPQFDAKPPRLHVPTGMPALGLSLHADLRRWGVGWGGGLGGNAAGPPEIPFRQRVMLTI